MASMADSPQPSAVPEVSSYQLEREEEKRIERQKWISNLYLFSPFLVIPALALSIAYSQLQNGVCAMPAVATIPMGLGAIYGIRRALKIRSRLDPKHPIRLSEGPTDNKQGNELLARAFEIVVNLTVAIAVLIILIYTWINEPLKRGDYYYYNYNQAAPWVGANATFFMMVSMLLHTYLAWLAVPSVEVLLEFYRSMTSQRSRFIDTHGRCRSCRTVIVQSSDTTPQPVPYTDV